MKKTLCSLVLASFFIISCNNSNDEKKTANTYEKVKLTVEEIEKKNPERFLSATGYEKKNLSFYSKTGALLEEDHEMIYETIAPGDSKSFKSKFFAAKGTDSVAVKVVSAGY